MPDAEDEPSRHPQGKGGRPQALTELERRFCAEYYATPDNPGDALRRAGSKSRHLSSNAAVMLKRRVVKIELARLQAAATKATDAALARAADRRAAKAAERAKVPTEATIMPVVASDVQAIVRRWDLLSDTMTILDISMGRKPVPGAKRLVQQVDGSLKEEPVFAYDGQMGLRAIEFLAEFEVIPAERAEGDQSKPGSNNGRGFHEIMEAFAKRLRTAQVDLQLKRIERTPPED